MNNRNQMNNRKIRLKILGSGLKYYHLNEVLGISDSTRCIMLRKELPEEEQDRICKLIDEYLSKGGPENE